MTDHYPSEPPRAPRRLIDTEGDLGLLLKDATQTAYRPTDEREAFAGVLRRQERRRVRAQWATGAAVCATLLVAWGAISQSSPLALRAESVKFLQPSATELGASESSKKPPELSQTPDLPGRTQTDDAASSSDEKAASALAVSRAKTGRADVPETSCKALTRAGQFEAALSCHQKEATGTGISAELAWLEQARISDRALGDQERALRTLETYLDRFPQGALNQEARLSRLDLLVSAGKNELAVTTIDALLQSGQARERTGELTALRAKLTSGKNGK